MHLLYYIFFHLGDSVLFLSVRGDFLRVIKEKLFELLDS